VATAEGELERTRTTLAETERERARRAEEAENEATERARLAESDAHGRIERDRLAQELVDARRIADEAAGVVGPLTEELAALRRARDAEHAALNARVEALAGERDALQDALAALQETLAAAQAAAEAQVTIVEEPAAPAMVGDSDPLLAAGAHAVEPAADEPVVEAESAVETAPATTAAPTPASAPAAAPAPASASPPAAAASAPTPAAKPAAAAAAEAATSHGGLAVIDASTHWEALASADSTITVIPPGADVPERLAAIGATRVLVNLAAKGALQALAAVRASGARASCWGCLTDPTGERGIPLGMIEPATRPLDPDAVLAALGAAAAKGARVITVGSDVDALMSLRQAMSRQGMSVSMAWDANQASDLLQMVRPDIVVVDLEQPPRVGYGLVMRLAQTDPVPRIVLIGGEAESGTSFTAELASPAHKHRAVPLARVLAKVLGRPDSGAAAKR
jgi:CheY-like chemotaxis protein